VHGLPPGKIHEGKIMAAWLKLLLAFGPELVGLIERIVEAVEAAKPPKRVKAAKAMAKAKAAKQADSGGAPLP
jgi:hypothetical protein